VRVIGRLWKRASLSALLAVMLPSVVASAAQATSITEFSSGVTAPSAITAGPDGNLWFTDTNAIGRITPAGTITEFKTNLNLGSMPFGDIVAGSDGNLWFADEGTTKAIGRITPSGVITEFDFSAGHVASNLVDGPDGNVWFLDGAAEEIGRITPAGTITEFGTADGLNPMSQPNDLTVGPDGNLWFTDQGDPKAIGRVTPAGAITEFTGPLTPSSFPNDITAGDDGNVWFTDDLTPAIGRVTPDGTITEFGTGLQTGSAPDSITAGSDGNVWFADQYSGQRAIGRITPGGVINEFHAGLSSGLPDAITVGADGNLWVEQSDPGGIARVTPAGAITEFTDGLNAGAGADGDQIVPGPDGNLWFNDGGATKAIGRALLLALPGESTGTASAISSAGATVSGSVTPLGMATTVAFQYGTTPMLGSTVTAGSLTASVKPATVEAGLSGLPSATLIYYRVTASNSDGTTNGAIKSFMTAKPPAGSTAVVGNQQLAVVVTPVGACVVKTKTISAQFSSTTIRHGTKLHFVSAAFYIDKGVKHSRKTKHGKTVVSYKANTVERHVPVTLKLRLSGLHSGTHTLKVKASYTKTVTEHGHHRKVTVSKTVSVKFRVC
jgi:streptogramin lyase